MRICLRSSNFNFDWASLIESYRSFVENTDSVLEIGASRPERTAELSLWCGTVTGVELHAGRTPEDFESVHYVTGDWQELSRIVPASSIDVAVASHVIEHVPDDRKAIDELFHVLAPGGVALINTPNRKRLTRAFIERFTGEREYPYWEHQREYTEEDLERLFSSSRFKRFEIIPLVLGLHGGPLFVYRERVPARFRRYANYWEAHLFKSA